MFLICLVFFVNIYFLIEKQYRKYQYNQYLKFQAKVVRAKFVWGVIHKDEINKVLEKQKKRAMMLEQLAKNKEQAIISQREQKKKQRREFTDMLYRSETLLK